MKFSDETVDFALYIALVQTPIWAEFQYQFQVETPRLCSESPPSIKPTPFHPYANLVTTGKAKGDLSLRSKHCTSS